MPLESILGPLLFNFFINDIFYFTQGAYICNFADGNSVYSIEDNFKEVKTMLRKKNFRRVVLRELDGPKFRKMSLLNNK